MKAKYIGFLQYANIPVFIIRFVLAWGIGFSLYELNKFTEAESRFRDALKISNDAEPMLALAIVLFSLDHKSIESLNLAKNALKSNPKYVSKAYQAKQLWGKKLQKSAETVFKTKEMKKVVREAKEKSLWINV